MSSDPLSTRRPRTGWRTLLAIIVIAFALGIGATALFLRQYRQLLPQSAQAMIDPAAPPAAGTAPGSFMPPPELGGLPPTADEQMLAARQATLAGQIAALEARAAEIDRESRLAAGNAGRAEAVLAVTAARRAIDRGQPLGAIEPMLRARFGAAQPREVALIGAAGRRPVTVADLRLELDAIAAELATGTAHDGWWAGFQRELAGLVVIRRESQPSSRPADRLARVRRQLDTGQVEAALDEVVRLPGAPSAMAWTDAARRYVIAHHALDALETAALMGANPQPAAAPAPAAAAAPAAQQPATTASRKPVPTNSAAPRSVMIRSRP